MATRLEQLRDYLDAGLKRSGEFKAQPIYEPHSDTLIFYARPDASYAERINQRLTLHLSLEDDSLIGCEIKGIKPIFKDCKLFGAWVEDSSIKLGIILLVAAGENEELNPYREQAAEQFRDVLIPEHTFSQAC